MEGGPIAKLRDGDMITLDAEGGTLNVEIDVAEWARRVPAQCDLSGHDNGMGRELFTLMRNAGSFNTGFGTRAA